MSNIRETISEQMDILENGIIDIIDKIDSGDYSPSEIKEELNKLRNMVY